MRNLQQTTFSRPAVFFLASLSFACLLGQFYHLWSMRLFACWVFPPAIALLVWAAQRDARARLWIVQGALGGIFAAVVYDLFRLPFVMNGYPLFGVFPKFGQMLLGAAPTDLGPAVQIVGWIYHFSNGAALGIMLLAMVTRPTPRILMWSAAAWALCVEIILLLTPYYSFFKLKLNFSEFLLLTLSAHLVFGIALGWWCAQRVATDGSSGAPLQTTG